MEALDEVNMIGDTIRVSSKEVWKTEFFNHKSALIIPKTAGGTYLLAMRAKNKHPWPGVWVCGVGGSCASGESFEQGAYREMKEEIGISTELETVCTIHYEGKDMNALFRIYTTKEEIDAESLTLDKNEIEYVQSFSMDELKELITQRPESCAPTAVKAIQHLILAQMD